jgi:hypothetical protein
MLWPDVNMHRKNPMYPRMNGRPLLGLAARCWNDRVSALLAGTIMVPKHHRAAVAPSGARRQNHGRDQGGPILDRLVAMIDSEPSGDKHMAGDGASPMVAD